MSNKFLGIGGRYVDENGVGRAKALKVDSLGNAETKIVGNKTKLIKEYIGDNRLLNSKHCSFGETVGETTLGIVPFDVSDYSGIECYVRNNYNVDITISFWSFKDTKQTTLSSRLLELYKVDIKSGEQKIINSEYLRGCYAGLVAYVVADQIATIGSMDILLLGSAIDTNYPSKIEVIGDRADVIELVRGYTNINNADDFIIIDGNNYISVSAEVVNKYKNFDIVITNTTNTQFRLAVRPVDHADTDPTIRLANGEYTRFSTSIADSAAQIIIPNNCHSLYVSQIPITRVGDGLEAYDPNIWQKYRGNLRIFMRAVEDNSSGYVSVWLIGYKY